MKTSRVLVLIPARYASPRFPGKPLAEIAGKSMIQRVYEGVTELPSSEQNSAPKIDAYVVTDDQRIEDHVKTFGGVVRVDDDVQSGTERIELAYQRFFKDGNYDLVINVQGDEPLIKPDLLLELVNFHLSSPFDITTLVKPMTDMDAFVDPNKVKVVQSKTSGECHYFSRSPIPFDRDGEGLKEWLLHIGVYSFKPESLVNFCRNDISFYENLEKLEQLRGLEAGMRFGAIRTNVTLMGVDTPEDLEKLEGVFGGH